MSPESQEPRMSPEAQRAIDALRGLRSPSYDVEAEFVRHRGLIAQGALPTLATKSWWTWGVSKLGWLTLGALVSLGVLRTFYGENAPAKEGNDVPTLTPARASSTEPESTPLPVLPSSANHEAQREPTRPSGLDLVDRPEASRRVTSTTRRSRRLRTGPVASSEGKAIGPAVQAEPAQAATSAEDPNTREASKEPSSTPTPEDPTQREIAELARAERLLASFPTRALALARESDARFTPGYLRQERRILIVRALLTSGERSSAERETARFLHEDSDPAFRKRLERVLLMR
jgi:hypothetical protein